ncbi:MAG TPA: hypothetical protein VEA44_12390 [Caulobacter sp.]|nr:hypothetical protein [Caulobacter sp.]
MTIHRRMLFAGLAGAGLAAAAPAPAQDQTKPALREKLRKAVLEQRRPLAIDGTGVSGPGWDWLVAEGRAAHAFALGEDHGIAQVPVVAGALMKALKPAGYSRMALEISPPVAPELDHAARRGLEGLKAYYRQHPPGPAFYTMDAEARMLAEVRRAFPDQGPMFWGLDYEIVMDRRLIARLKSKAPPRAHPALAALEKASRDAWAAFEAQRNPGLLFCFSGDPALVSAVQAAWRRPDPASAEILDTLRQSLVINQHQTARRYFQSNAARAAFNRANLVRRWRTEGGPKTLFKFGAGHMVRGRSMTEVYDLGALIPEAAALAGGTSFHLLAISGPGGRRAVFNPVAWTYDDTPSEGMAEMGLGFMSDLVFPQGSTLVDLRPLRPLMPGSVTETASPTLSRVVHGFDAVLLIGGATASKAL